MRNQRKVHRQNREASISTEKESESIVDKNVLEFVEFSEVTEEVEENVVESFLIDVGVQVNSGDFTELNFSSFLTTDRDLSSATGIPNFQMLNMFIKIVERLGSTFILLFRKMNSARQNNINFHDT